MKKVLIVTDAWFPFVTGVGTALCKIREEAERSGYRVTVVHPGMFLAVPFPFYAAQPIAVFPRRKLQRLMLEEQPDYVHIATEWTIGYTARSICLRWNIPFTTSYHTNMAAYVRTYFRPIAPIAAWLATFYMRWFHNAAAATLSNSPTMQRELAAAGFTRVAPWQLGVDTELFSPERATEGAPLEYQRPIFSYVGRIAKEKNIEEFLEARLPGTKLIIGDGPELARLRETYVGRAVFLGCKRGAELARLVAQADTLVFPSRTETFGLVMLEALASGVPVAAHCATGPKDVITSGVDGYLHDDIAHAATACLSLPVPSAACRAKAEQFAWAHSARMFMEAVQPSVIREWPEVSSKARARGPALGEQMIHVLSSVAFAVRSLFFPIKNLEKTRE